jgi:hypothetical protein
MKPVKTDDGQLMITAAHRYCLGRRTYISSACVDWLKACWPELNKITKQTTIRDTRETLKNNRAGDCCDVEMWKDFLYWVEQH